jgi:hypothetical protein
MGEWIGDFEIRKVDGVWQAVKDGQVVHADSVHTFLCQWAMANSVKEGEVLMPERPRNITCPYCQRVLPMKGAARHIQSHENREEARTIMAKVRGKLGID